MGSERDSINRYPTELLTILEPKYWLIKELCVGQKRRSTRLRNCEVFGRVNDAHLVNNIFPVVWIKFRALEFINLFNSVKHELETSDMFSSIAFSLGSSILLYSQCFCDPLN